MRVIISIKSTPVQDDFFEESYIVDLKEETEFVVKLMNGKPVCVIRENMEKGAD